MILRLIDQSMVDGVEGEFEAVGDPEFVKDVMEMVLDGLLGDKKFFADFFVAETLSDELNDLFLAVAEKRLLTARAGLGRFREGLHDLGGHAVVEPDFAGMDAVNAFHEKIRSRLFQDDAASTEPHGADNVAIIFGSGEHDDARGQLVEIDFFKNGEAVFIGHAEIEQENIGLEFGEELDALSAVLSFADNGDFVVGVEELAQAISEDGVVIG